MLKEHARPVPFCLRKNRAAAFDGKFSHTNGKRPFQMLKFLPSFLIVQRNSHLRHSLPTCYHVQIVDESLYFVSKAIKLNFKKNKRPISSQFVPDFPCNP